MGASGPGGKQVDGASMMEMEMAMTAASVLAVIRGMANSGVLFLSQIRALTQELWGKKGRNV